jgi:hypothetical protein
VVATTAELSARQIDTRLRVIGKALRELPEAERRWADPTIPADERERERLVFHYEWDDQTSSTAQVGQKLVPITLALCHYMEPLFPGVKKENGVGWFRE